jgi:hypothetical protein
MATALGGGLRLLRLVVDLAVEASLQLSQVLV